MVARNQFTEPIIGVKTNDGKKEYYFKDNIKSVATTLIVDCWLPKGILAEETLTKVMGDAAEAAGFTNFKASFDGDSKYFVGVVRSLHEHIILHVDFRKRFATIDVLSRGGSMPQWAIRVILDLLQPDVLTVTEHRRGVQQ